MSAALQPRGIPAATVAAALGGLLEWYVSEAILSEYEDVLRRDKFPFNRRWVNQHLEDIRKAAVSVDPVRIVDAASDEPDNRFLECAETAKADFPITGNIRHFPMRWAGTTILAPRAFVDLWQKQVEAGE